MVGGFVASFVGLGVQPRRCVRGVIVDVHRGGGRSGRVGGRGRSGYRGTRSSPRRHGYPVVAARGLARRRRRGELVKVEGEWRKTESARKAEKPAKLKSLASQFFVPAGFEMGVWGSVEKMSSN